MKINTILHEMEQFLYNVSVKTRTKFVTKGELTVRVINPEVLESIPDCGTGCGYFGYLYAR